MSIDLALSKEIVNPYHGIIRAESPEGQGAVFTVELLLDKDYYRPSEVDSYVSDTETVPAATDRKVVIDLEKEPEEELEIDASLSTLLLVEDNRDLYQLIRLQLGDKLNIYITSNGVEGLKKVHLYHPDIVVTDQMVPEMDGLEMLQSIRKDFRISHIPIIIPTAKSNKGAKAKAIALDVNAYVARPFSKEYLLARIDQLSGERKLFRGRIRQQMENQMIAEEDNYEQYLVKKDVQFLEKIHQVIEENMDDSDFNIDTIASGTGLSCSVFFKKLKNLTGLVPVGLVKEIRLNRSIGLIKNMNLSVSEMAFAVGFKDSSYYSKCFHEKYNWIPREYMNEWRKGQKGRLQNTFLVIFFKDLLRLGRMNKIKEVLSAWMSVAYVLPATAQYPVIPGSVKEGGAKQEAEFEQKSNTVWEKVLPTVLEEVGLGKPHKPRASKPEDLIKSSIPAFPGVEGGGIHTPGGYGGKMIVVTSLEDSGPGTFHEACGTDGARVTVSNVSGIIRLRSPTSVHALYVATVGQAASGDGICMTGRSSLIDTHGVAIRHIRFHRGTQDVAFRDDVVGGNAVGNIIVDHCLANWGPDENMSTYRHVYNRDKTEHGLKLPTVNTTIQNSMFSEAPNTCNHAFGTAIGGHNNIFCRSLLASSISYNSSVGMDGGSNFEDSVVFDWWSRSVDEGDNKSSYNIINNYFKPGLITPLDKPIFYHILKPEAGRDKSKPMFFGKAYVNGNIVHGNVKVIKNSWNGGIQLASEMDERKLLPQIRAGEVFEMSPATTTDTKKACSFVLDNVGAILSKRDAIDVRVTKTVQTGKVIYMKDAPELVSPYTKRRLSVDFYKQGIITDIRQVGGFPEYKEEVYLDSDGDGMPDAWGIASGLNPNDPTDAKEDCNGGGYTNVEKYINGLDIRKKVDRTDLRNNYDTLSKRKSLL